MIELSNISKHFDLYNRFSFSRKSSLDILKDVSYKIEFQDSLGIVGKNGSGKSTLLKVIFGAILPDKGEVKLNGKHISNYDTLNRFAFFGNNDRSFFWRLNVEENLNYFKGVYRKQENKTNRLLFENLSIEKLLKKTFGTLSSGEKKKVLLYRGLLKDPDFLLFDEFTQSLDLPSKKEIESIIKILQKDYKKTIIWVSHDIDEIFRICNKVILIKDGAISESRLIDNKNFEEMEKFQKIVSI